MSDLDIAVENILDEDDDVESEKEQDTMDWAELSAKNPTNEILEPSLGLHSITQKSHKTTHNTKYSIGK